MGLPVIDVQFTQLTETAVERSERGIVALLLEDTGATMASYSSALDSMEGWSEASKTSIKMALMSGAASVLAVPVQTAEETLNYSDTLDAIANMNWNWLAAPQAASANLTTIVTWVKEARANGNPKKAVLASATTPNSEGIVNFTTSNISSTLLGTATTYTSAQYTPRVAGILAGISLDRSVTGYVFDDVVSADASATPDDDIDAGQFILIFNGESYEAARGVTSLTSTQDVPALFKKIKHVEGADLIAQDLVAIFKQMYKGVKPNTYANKQALMADFTAYFKGLEGSVLSPDFANIAALNYDAIRSYLVSKGVDVALMTDIQILKANTEENVFVKANIQLLDAMEDITITVVLN